MKIRKNTFPKDEKLKKRQQIESLFSRGRSFEVYPFRLLWIAEENRVKPPLKAGISVPRKSVRKAVDRNLLKRRFREAYRNEKHALAISLLEKNQCMKLFFIYKSTEILPYEEIQNSVKDGLRKLREQVAG